MEIDIQTCLQAEQEDEYEKIKDILRPTENIDYPELVDKGFFLWFTEKAEISIFCEIENVINIKVRDDNDSFGRCCTYDLDSYALVCCVMSAIRDYIKDLQTTFVNTLV